VDGRRGEDNSPPRPLVRLPKAETALLCLVVRLAESEAAVTASRLGSEAEAARLLAAPWHLCSFVPSKIDDEVRPLVVVAGDSRRVVEWVLGTHQEVTRYLLRVLACHSDWDCLLQARQQETAALPMTIRMRVRPLIT
jgi:hypothetical protein